MKYKNDPRPIVVRYPGKCKTCGQPLKRGDAAYYWPATKTMLCVMCGAEEYQQFLAFAQDEDIYNNFY